jgi:hypothetical protein
VAVLVTGWSRTKTYTVEAQLTAQTPEQIEAAAQVTFGEGKVCAEATARFSMLGEAQARHATDAAALDPSFLR